MTRRPGNRRRTRRDEGVHVVILAGGSGARLWPWSRTGTPKPLLPLTGATTPLREAWSRALRLAPVSKIWVVTPRVHAARIRAAIAGLRADRLLVEPAPRDTAPALALAAVTIAAIDADARFLVAPSDHAIDDAAAWERAARRALAESRRGAIVCLGVPPRGPSSSYGYLLCSRPPRSAVVDVERFVEKPGRAVARRLIATRRSLWNAGSFAASVASFLGEAERQRPDIVRAAHAAAAGLPAAWKRLEGRSVDHAVLEGARRVRAVRLGSAWDDLGSWDVIARRVGRPDPRKVLTIDAPGSVALPHGRFIAIVGVPRVIVVDTPDALLVVASDKAQEVRKIAPALARAGRRDLLRSR